MRGSIVTPLILIGAGILLLVANLNPEISIWRLMLEYWPWLLIAWGSLRAGEILLRYTRGQALPAQGISGGEWALVIFLSLGGSAFIFGSNMTNRIRSGQLGVQGMKIFGQNYDYPVEGRLASPAKPRILIENRRGNVRIVGMDKPEAASEVSVTGRYMIKALDRQSADAAHQRVSLDLVAQGEQIIVRTNQERAELDTSLSADLEIQVPRGASVECRGTYGDFEVNMIDGDYEVRSDNAGVRGQDIGGKVRVDLNRSDIVRLERVKGSVDIKGARAGDVDLDEIEGPVSVDGSFDDLDFRRLNRGVRFVSRQTDMQAERIPGRVHLSGGDLEGVNLSGAFRLRSRSKDVRLNGFDGPIDIDLNRGDIELSPGRGQFAGMVAKTSGGDVTVYLPEGAKFNLRGNTEKGQVENSYGPPLVKQEFDRGGSIAGNTGGPQIQMETRRGTIRVARGSESTVTNLAAPAAPKAPRMPPASPKAPPVLDQ